MNSSRFAELSCLELNSQTYDSCNMIYNRSRDDHALCAIILWPAANCTTLGTILFGVFGSTDLENEFQWKFSFSLFLIKCSPL